MTAFKVALLFNMQGPEMQNASGAPTKAVLESSTKKNEVLLGYIYIYISISPIYMFVYIHAYINIDKDIIDR